MEEELEAALSRPRYVHSSKPSSTQVSGAQGVTGHRHGHRSLGQFFGREGVEICGIATQVLSPSEFQKIKTDDNLQLAYDLGRRAFLDYPDCDGLHIGGGAWLAEPAARALENEFGKPVVCNQTAAIRKMMILLNDWKPLTGHGRVLATP